MAAALRAAAARSVAVVEQGRGDATRSTIEAAAYFCCLEAIQNAAKHAGAATVRVELDGGAGRAAC